MARSRPFILETSKNIPRTINKQNTGGKKRKMVMKIVKIMKDRKGQTRALLKGFTERTRLNDIAKKYSKNYALPFFLPRDLRKGILLIKRKKPLKKPLSTWLSWERR